MNANNYSSEVDLSAMRVEQQSRFSCGLFAFICVHSRLLPSGRVHVGAVRNSGTVLKDCHRSLVSAFLLATFSAILCVTAPTVQAELPSIRFDRMAPLSAGAGTAVEVDVAGRDIEDVKALLFDRPGLVAELVKPGKFKISVAADLPEGTYDVRLVGRFGVSNPRLFAVTRDLTDVPETEPNNTVAQSQTVAVNSAIHGTSDGNGQDVFRFPARQ